MEHNQKITVKVPAKVNLALDVCGLLPGGYHQLDMLMQAVTLYETLTLEKRSDGVLKLHCCDGQGRLSPDIPTDNRNLAWRAAELFFSSQNCVGGVELTVCKAVPSQAGMAGGSADAAGVLFGLNHLYQTGLTLSQLCALGQALGSDVPFCLTGGTARVGGRGEQITPVKPLPPCFLVAAMPHSGSSTPQGFARYDALPNPFHPDVPAAAAALQRGDLHGLCLLAGNALQQACATLETEEILTVLQAEGALAALLTGTGAVTYGIFETRPAAEQAAARLAQRFSPVFCLQPEARGPFLVP